MIYGFRFVVEYGGTLTLKQSAARRGPDYLVRVPRVHPLFVVGSACLRHDGAAAPPAGEAAAAAVIHVFMTLGVNNGLVGYDAIGPPYNTALYNSHWLAIGSSLLDSSAELLLDSARKFQTLAS